jgi:hypothetical protein
MGLTIHWKLRSGPEATARDVRRAIEALRDRARDLPFQEVSDVIDRKGNAADFNKVSKNDPLRWFLIQAQGIEIVGEAGIKRTTPTRVIGVRLQVGNGCEDTNLMLCKYRDEPGWSGRGFTKTQYASNPVDGGIANFLRCHLSIVAVLDKAKELGILEDVSDEGHFWESRNAKALADNVGKWNEMMAAFVMWTKDAVLPGTTVVSAMSAFPNVEHLEAQGAKKLGNLAAHFRGMFET